MLRRPRSGIGAVRAASDTAHAGRPTLAVLSVVRTGLPGSADERDGGDGAVAFLFSNDGRFLVEHLATASSTGEFLDRWRNPGDASSKVWEERFGEAAYLPLAEAAITDAWKQAGITADQIDHLIVAGVHARAVKRVAASAGVRAEAVVDDRTSTIGNLGTAQAGVLLADVLDRAQPGQVIVLVSLADGADVTVYRTTDAIASFQPAATVQQQVDAGSTALPYATFLTWRGMLTREPPRRPDPERPAAPPAL